MSLFVVVGAGGTGTATVLMLTEAGHRLRLVTRRGPAPTVPESNGPRGAVPGTPPPNRPFPYAIWPPTSAQAAGVSAPKLGRTPGWMLALGGLFNPRVTELPEAQHQFR